MDDQLLGIGATARASGLPPSALRFYDAAGVLRPAVVDPRTGYRRYTSDQVAQARIVARLRRVDMPLADIVGVLATRHDPDAAQRLLDRHLRRLEGWLDEARDALGEASALLAEAPATRFTADPDEFARAYAAVRYAVAGTTDRVALTGVLLDLQGDILRLVASDRYRLAVAVVPVQHVDGPPLSVVGPVEVLDALPTSSGPADAPDRPDRLDRPARTPAVPPVGLALRPHRIEWGGTTAATITSEFPDYRSILTLTARHEATVRVADVAARVKDAEPAPGDFPDVVGVRLGLGGVDVVRPTEPGAVAFDRRYLLEALDATTSAEVVMSVDAARDALCVAHPTRDDRSLLMPVRLAA